MVDWVGGPKTNLPWRNWLARRAVNSKVVSSSLTGRVVLYF
jgi:hypothetical protein